MRANRARNTGPELRLRKALREAGLGGYRLNWKKAPGRPDIAYPGRKVAIFVHGCYWHHCPRCYPNLPSPTPSSGPASSSSTANATLESEINSTRLAGPWWKRGSARLVGSRRHHVKSRRQLEAR